MHRIGKARHTQCNNNQVGKESELNRLSNIKGHSEEQRTADPHNIIVSNDLKEVIARIEDANANVNAKSKIDNPNILDAENPPVSETWRPSADTSANNGIENVMSSTETRSDSSDAPRVGIDENGIYRKTADQREYIFRNANGIRVTSLELAMGHQDDGLVSGLSDDGEPQSGDQQSGDQQNGDQKNVQEPEDDQTSGHPEVTVTFVDYENEDPKSIEEQGDQNIENQAMIEDRAMETQNIEESQNSDEVDADNESDNESSSGSGSSGSGESNSDGDGSSSDSEEEGENDP